jgi:hypothetical protein
MSCIRFLSFIPFILVKEVVLYFPISEILIERIQRARESILQIQIRGFHTISNQEKIKKNRRNKKS